MTDYIKRENAKRAVWGCARDTGIDEAPFEYAEGLLEDVPSADVAPIKHGRWKPFDRTYGRSIFACSECGECTDVPTEMGEPIFGYCPNCGARMDGEGKNDDKSCDTCKHYDKGWDDIICDGCTKAHSNWERKDDE